MNNGTRKAVAAAGWTVLAALGCVGLPGCSDGGVQHLREELALALGEGPHAGETKTIALPRGAEMEMVWCPPGVFEMGSPAGEAGRGDDEKQRHVTVTNGFWMAKTEVTQAQWQSVTGKNPSKFKGNDLPVESVSRNECLKFCRKTGLQLPTEAEWEYACRAGSGGAYAGSGRLDEMGWFEGNSGDRTHPVGQKGFNAWGLQDMHGNVFEYCADDDREHSRVFFVVTRGGCWAWKAEDCRSAARGHDAAGNKNQFTGFRPCFPGGQ